MMYKCHKSYVMLYTVYYHFPPKLFFLLMRHNWTYCRHLGVTKYQASLNRHSPAFSTFRSAYLHL